MKRLFQILGGLIGVCLIGVAGVYLVADRDMRALMRSPPADTDLLFWSDATRQAAFRVLDRLPFLAETNVIQAGGSASPLPLGDPLTDGVDIGAYMASQRAAALIIVQGGAVRFEEYGLDFDSDGRWTSFSVAKSVTSTLVGAAVEDGFIDSLDDKVSTYIDGLRGSVYDDVSIRQLLTMTSGVAWTEDYGDPESDVAKFNNHRAAPGEDATVSYLKTLTRAAPAGERWHYSTGETNLIGVLVSAATGKTVSEYLSEKIWSKAGMQQDATWLLGSTGHEISGCCIQAATRDFARFGLFIMNGAQIAGEPVMPPEFLAEATSLQATFPDGDGYGYQWWINADGSFAAQGIFGQGIFIDPARDLVIAQNANWPAAAPEAQRLEREAFYDAIQAAIDAERGPSEQALLTP